MELERAKGTRDFSPAEKILRQEVIDRLRNIFELYGYSPLETPIIERFEILAAKYAGGAEILKETFRFKDQGGRELGLRYDLTVPLARYIGMNPNIKLPFKRYQIGQVFRDGPIKTGRQREFWQCDVDVIGVKSMAADAECIKIALDFFKSIGLKVIIEVNNRKLLNGLMESLQIPEQKRMDVIAAIDKLKKVPISDVEKELAENGIEKKKIDELFRILNTPGTNLQKLEKLRKLVKTQQGIEGLNEIEKVLSYLSQKNVIFSISLARGLSYYTGTVFEVFMKKGEFKSSLAAGGRWDKMIGDYLESNREYPAVGISFGIEPITIILKELKELKKLPQKTTITDVYVIPIQPEKTLKKTLKIVDELRKSGIKADMDLSGRGISKNLDYANSYNIPYVVFIGVDELRKKKLKLKNMRTGKEEFLDIKKIINKLKNLKT